MNLAALASLLQAATLLLTGVRGAGSAIVPATAQAVVNVAGNAVQIATQAMAPVGFPVVENNGRWPNMNDLLNAPYRDASGKWVRLGSSVQLMQEDTSFGDLNHDGVDDAAVVVKKITPLGSANYFLVAMLNQGGIMFDIAELPLGASFAASSHTIANDLVALNGKQYELIGNSLGAL